MGKRWNSAGKEGLTKGSACAHGGGRSASRAMKSKDDPKKRRVDRRFLSSQKHEEAYMVKRLRALYPHRSRAEVELALLAARITVKRSEGRQRILVLCHYLLRHSSDKSEAPGL